MFAACGTPRYREVLTGNDHDAATVFLPCGFGRAGIDGPFLAETDGMDTVGIGTERHEIVPHSRGAPFPESDIVFPGTALIRMTFDDDAYALVLA